MKEEARSNRVCARKWSKAILAAVVVACLSIGVFTYNGIAASETDQAAIAVTQQNAAPEGGQETEGAAKTEKAEKVEKSADAADAADADVASTEPEGDKRNAAGGGGQDPASADAQSRDGRAYVSDEVLIQVPEGTSAANLNEALAKLDYVTTKSVSDEDVELGWARLELQKGYGVEQAVSDLEASGVTASAQPNYKYHLLDSSASTGLAAGSIATESTEEPWYLSAINANKAQTYLKKMGPDIRRVTVAVLDTGCDVNHKYFKEHGSRIVGGNDVADVDDDVADSVGHGTHVAGIVAHTTGGAQIMPVKIFNDGDWGTDSFTICKGFKYVIKSAKKYNVCVISMSVGCDWWEMIDDNRKFDYGDTAAENAIDEAYHAGILSVFAGGNADWFPAPFCEWPGDRVENAISVINAGNFTDSDSHPIIGIDEEVTNFNAYGMKTKQLTAPGTDILSSVPGGGIEAKTGTSMAAPCVAGVAAMAYASSSGILEPSEIKSVLFSSAWDMRTDYDDGTKKSVSGHNGFDAETGFGLVNAYEAVRKANGYHWMFGDTAVKKGESVQLKALAGTGTWSYWSDNTGVARVDSATGEVTGMSAGEAIIAATDGNETLYQQVAVYDPYWIGPESIQVGKSKNVKVKGRSYPYSNWKYSSSNTSIATVNSSTGAVLGKKAGTVIIAAQSTALPSMKITREVQITKAGNTMVAKAKKTEIGISRSTVKTSKRVLSKTAAFTISNAKGKVTFTKAGGDAKVAVSKDGKLTLAKGLAKGKHVVKVTVKAAGDGTYQPKSVTVQVVIRVK